MQNLVKFFGTTVLAVACPLLIYGCGANALTDDISDVAPKTLACNSAVYSDTMGYAARLKKYNNDPQCQSQVQAAESYRQSAIANCSAGSKVNADANYEYYKKSLTLVNSFCP